MVQAVPGYHTLIAHPMDLSTMADKAAHGAYKSFTPFVHDFELMIRNCLQFNRNNVFFYKAGERMKRMVCRASTVHEAGAGRQDYIRLPRTLRAAVGGGTAFGCRVAFVPIG
jgi:hypothetical protein